MLSNDLFVCLKGESERQKELRDRAKKIIESAKKGKPGSPVAVAISPASHVPRAKSPGRKSSFWVGKGCGLSVPCFAEALLVVSFESAPVVLPKESSHTCTIFSLRRLQRRPKANFP